MKKVVALAIIIQLLFASGASAQDYDQALGVRLGRYSGITYKFRVSSTTAFDGTFTFGSNTVGVAGSYLFHFPINEVADLSWYAGAGGHLIFVDRDSNLWKDSNGIAIGPNATIGIEYTPKNVPLSIGADIGPFINLTDYVGVGVHGGIFVRYTF